MKTINSRSSWHSRWTKVSLLHFSFKAYCTGDRDRAEASATSFTFGLLNREASLSFSYRLTSVDTLLPPTSCSQTKSDQPKVQPSPHTVRQDWPDLKETQKLCQIQILGTLLTRVFFFFFFFEVWYSKKRNTF